MLYEVITEMMLHRIGEVHIGSRKVRASAIVVFPQRERPESRFTAGDEVHQRGGVSRIELVTAPFEITRNNFV